jgi:phage protein U
MMMCLGNFVFGLDTMAFQELQRQNEWKHPSTSRVHARDAHQYTGPGEDTINLTGWFSPSLAGNPASFDELRELGDKGEGYVLVDGEGKVYGAYVINSLSESQNNVGKTGQANRFEFTIKLTRVDE